MQPAQRRYDEYGFPIPPTFEDETAAAGSRLARRKGRRSPLLWGLLIVFVALVLASLSGKHLPLDIRATVAHWYFDRAQQGLREDNLPAALRDLEKAVSWLPEEEDLYQYRANLRCEMHDLQGSLEDFDHVIQRSSSDYSAYIGRSIVYQRLARHRDAIDDSTKAVELTNQSAPALNHRAYTRARAVVELDEALQDVELALTKSPNEPAYLDTRAYILFLQGENDRALEDMERAIDLMEPALGSFRRTPREKRALRESMAVMYFHRGQILEKAGEQRRAKRDLRLALEMGYDPESGVF